MESQRVKTLTEGYLRGWLNFSYPLKTSKIREALICKYIEEKNLYDLLQNKLFIETVLRSNVNIKGKDVLEPIFDVNKSLIELKLPSVAPKGKIKKSVAEDLAEWKEFLDKANAALKAKKS